MRLLADENIPLDAIRALRDAGHDVFSASESSPGSPDSAHIFQAIEESRLILTFDLDFGLLAATADPRPAAGVLILRLASKKPEEVATLLRDLLARPDVVWRGHLSVVDRVHLRQRPL